MEALVSGVVMVSATGDLSQTQCRKWNHGHHWGEPGNRSCACETSADSVQELRRQPHGVTLDVLINNAGSKGRDEQTLAGMDP